jgi:hypothetical protein
MTSRMSPRRRWVVRHRPHGASSVDLSWRPSPGPAAEPALGNDLDSFRARYFTALAFALRPRLPTPRAWPPVSLGLPKLCAGVGLPAAPAPLLCSWPALLSTSTSTWTWTWNLSSGPAWTREAAPGHPPRCLSIGRSRRLPGPGTRGPAQPFRAPGSSEAPATAWTGSAPL